MKTIITVSALALISNIAMADAFDYEKQSGSQDLDPSATISDSIRNPEASTFQVRVSLNDWYQGNPDVADVPYSHDGIEQKIEGGMLSNYDVLSQANPDMTS